MPTQIVQLDCDPENKVLVDYYFLKYSYFVTKN